MTRIEMTLRDGLAAQIALRAQGVGPDVLYVHGSTFGCEQSLFFKMDDLSWADDLTRQGLRAWGFDFVGYGASSRYAQGSPPRGRGDEVAGQLLAVLAHIQASNGGRPVALLAHSWGCTVAARVAAIAGSRVAGLVMFGPVAVREGAPQDNGDAPATILMSAWAQYQRFVVDVPRHEPAVLDDRHFDLWQRGYLASDPASGERAPAAVQVPGGPALDVAALWSGQALFDLSAVTQPTIVVRGAWDSVCTDADAAYWTSRLGGAAPRDEVLPRGTHLMHLESGRHALYAACRRHLTDVFS